MDISTFGHDVTNDGDIRPGDRVTMLLYADMWTRTSYVDTDGFYVGCGAVEQGRGRVVAVHRPSGHALATRS